MARLPEYISNSSATVSSAPRAGMDSFGGGQGLVALGQAVSNAGDVALHLEKLKKERDATAYIAEQATSLQLNSLKTLEAMKTDGQPIDTFSERFSQEFQQQLKPLVDNAPNDVAKKAMEQHALQIQANLEQKAILYQANEKVSQQKQSSITAADNIINSYSIDPVNFNEYRKQLATLQDSSTRYMSPSDHDAFITKSNSEFATARVRSILDVNPWKAEEVLKDPEVASHLTPAAFETLSARIDAKKESVQNKILAQQNKDLRDFQEDPAALAARNGADMNDPQDVIDKSYLKQSDGTIIKVAPNNISIIPKKQAAFIANQLNGINQPDAMVGSLEQIRKQYGDDYFSYAIRDLKNNGLSADAAFIAHMEPVQDKHIIDASFAIDSAGAKKGEGVKVVTDMAKARAATQNDKFSDIDMKVAQNLQDVTTAMVDEGIPANEVNNIQTRTSNIASYLYTKSGNIDVATKQATDWINAKYNLGEVNDKKFRAPPLYNIHEIERGLDFVLKDIKSTDITAVNQIGSSEFMMQNLKSRGYFTLNGDETGYILRDEFGIPVRAADKISIYTVPIKDAILKNSDTNKKSAKQNVEDNIKYLQEAP